MVNIDNISILNIFRQAVTNKINIKHIIYVCIFIAITVIIPKMLYICYDKQYLILIG